MEIDPNDSKRRQEQCKHGLKSRYCAECNRRSRQGRVQVGDYIDITEADAAEFVHAIAVALETDSSHHLRPSMVIRPTHGGVAVSFDAAWKAFLGHTAGYNNDTKLPRVPIREPSRVLDVCREWLMKLDRTAPGGRVFIDLGGVHCDNVPIGLWRWHGPSPVEAVVGLFFSPRSTAQDA